jgi:hypothetical protein
LTGRSRPPRLSSPFAARTRSPQVVFNARFMPDGKTLIFSSAFTGSDPSLFESREDGSAPRPFAPPRTHLLSISKSGELAVITGTTHIGAGTPIPIEMGALEQCSWAVWFPDGKISASAKSRRTGAGFWSAIESVPGMQRPSVACRNR